MIEDYVLWGGDGGLTEATMREACGMPARDLSKHLTRASTVIAIEDDADVGEAKDSAETQDEKLRKWLMDHMLKQSRADITKAMLLRTKIPDAPNQDKESIVQYLVDSKILAVSRSRGKSEHIYRLTLACADIKDVVNMNKDESEVLVFPEQYHLQRFDHYVNAYGCRQKNACLLGEFYQKARATVRHKQRGRP